MFNNSFVLYRHNNQNVFLIMIKKTTQLQQSDQRSVMKRKLQEEEER